MDLLARREYARLELRRRLMLKFADDVLIDEALEKLADEGLLSDERFAESYVRHRSSAGFGPQRILLELRERGVRDELAKAAINGSRCNWQDNALAARNKKFGALPACDAKSRAARARFLQYRGFSADHIAELENSA
ncbi:MAG: recombination regulator RecX [Gammaproteobacteria bacterium]|nr:recombination regulator RecX [Gammaproteobacteria bacterium]MBT8152191.1 recombination regulator RecX [Gammaproteobacteria bacterium]NND38719.1 regulatory protein RecX [Pseudomonadales bacterium]NNL10777.1 regulatory protein RecX [Pseudomonadales bacterium]NNM12183.1 regulatory protein RecX [Pseudomonadales bacterium]